MLLLPTTEKTRLVEKEKWQAFRLMYWLLIGAAVTLTVSFPARVLNVNRWPFFGAGPLARKRRECSPAPARTRG